MVITIISAMAPKHAVEQDSVRVIGPTGAPSAALASDAAA